ncbi:hypothetical protein MBH78_08655 [Oceanimonas sp. NS1]|nr:hypothetical protein [Oceanimonas sp. NS1]
MLYVNDQYIDQAWFADAGERLRARPALADCHRYRYAVCLSNTADWLAWLFLLRRERGGVLPLHGELPLAAARRAAQRAGCHWLIHGEHSERLAGA